MKNYYGLLIFIYLTYPATSQVKFVIESLPETTPAQDSIFITGTFNNWNTTDPACLLRKQPNGQLSIVLDFDEPVVEYKFTRGDWLKVETGEQNQYIPNRTYLRRGTTGYVPIQILNWQDLGRARRFEDLALYYFATALMSAFLLVLSTRIFNKETYRRRIFVMLHGALLLLFLGVVAYNIVNPIWQTYLLIISQTGIFAWGPILYFLGAFLENRSHLRIHYMHFLPTAMAGLIAVLRLTNLDALAFFSFPAIGMLSWGQFLMLGAGGIFALWFLVGALEPVERQDRGNVHWYIRIILVIHSTGLCLMFMGLCAEAFLPELNDDYKWFFILLSSMIWLETIMLWKKPHFFREKAHVFHIDKADELLSKLKTLMEKDKVYHEAELNVNRLAELMDTKPHVLSKLLNAHFEQSFRDFVKCYRVKDFINQAEEVKLEKLTFLG